MAETEELNLRIRVVNEDEVASQLDDLTRERKVAKTGGGSDSGGGGASALATGAATAVFNRLADAIKSLESSVGSAFDAATSNAEKQASILEGLGNTISPAIGAAIKGALGPQVETEQQTISRVLAQLQQAAEAIALAQGKDATPASIRSAINDKLGVQINALSDIERRRAQGSVALQQVLAERSKGVDVGQASEQAIKQTGIIGNQAAEQIPGLQTLLTLLGVSAEKQTEAADKQTQAAEVIVKALSTGGLGAGLQAYDYGKTKLGDNGGG